MASVVNRSAGWLTKRIININSRNCIRSISTSEKKKDGVTKMNETLPKDIPDFSKPLENKNWVTYGFDRKDEKTDLNFMHNFAFMGVTMMMVIGGFFLVYFPDFKNLDWAQREAFLEIRRRESLGLPLIDKNYIDPSLIVLPTDEELGDTEIII